MSKTYLIMLEPKYSIVVETEESYLLDPSPVRFITGKKDSKKYFINRDRILFFREYNETTDKALSKQW